MPKREVHPQQRKRYARLYSAPLPATRSGALFNAHSYPTKVSPDAIALAIATHTRPGGLVFDGFGGSCTTALGALLCSHPSAALKAKASALGLSPIWGPRRTVVYELSGLGSFIGETLTARPDPNVFVSAANRVLAEAERRVGWIYQSGKTGLRSQARYFIWSDLLECEDCGKTTSLWDACVRFKPARILDRWKCRACGHNATLAGSSRVVERTFDSITGKSVRSNDRKLVRVADVEGGKMSTRASEAADLQLVGRIEREKIPSTVPIVSMLRAGGREWGDLWRAGYHKGITHVHHFYTRRNLIALGTLHELVQGEKPEIRDALRLWLSSYNHSHSTLMSRVVAKQGQKDLILTGAQSGVLYISGLPVEKNVFYGLRRKLKTFSDAFESLRSTNGLVEVRQASCTEIDLPDASVDYVFTDPPFGGNIPYSEANFISEAWLGRYTTQREEVVVSQSQQKSLSSYGTLLTRAFREMRRVLKPSGRATVLFHSTQADVWGALRGAYSNAGFEVELSNILDKQQGSFKQVTTKNFAKGDPMLLLRRKKTRTLKIATNSSETIERLVNAATRLNDPNESLPERLYSRFVEYYLAHDAHPPIDADEFYAQLVRSGVAT